jgi:CheY-like chemotaxis protein/HPt (histidine-containing phosphotransfer) domain-containing protein
MVFARTQGPFDMVIVDVLMPRIDGLMLARQLRNNPLTAALPLVILSSVGTRELDKLLKQAGLGRSDFLGILSKPVKQAQLVKVLQARFTKPSPDGPKPGHKGGAPRIDAELSDKRPLHILVAEDNEVNQRVAVRMLERMGYQAEVAATGTHVLQKLKGSAYDVILMDVQMPEMDGLEATRQISALYPGTRPQIIGLTANAMKGDRERCLEAGMDDYLSKPIRTEALQTALRIAAARRGRQTHKSRHVDGTVLQSLKNDLGSDSEAFEEILGHFVLDTAARLADMESAIGREDLAQIAQLAHSLRSSSSYVGAEQLGALCARVEAESQTAASVDSLASIIAEAKHEYAIVSDELKGLVETPGGDAHENA